MIESNNGKSNDSIINDIYFVIKYDKSINNKQLINNSLTNLKEHSFLKRKFNVNLVYSVHNNLKNILIHNKPFLKFHNFYSQSCNDVKCNLCLHSLKTNEIKFNDGLVLPILSNVNCSAVNCVYILICTKCNYYYIGETSKFCNRLRSHFSKIRLFHKFFNFTEVGCHFNLKEHSYIKDLKWIVFKHNINNATDRISVEQDLIRIFIQSGINVMNNKILPYSIKNFFTCIT
jgi:hypothetical protein